MATGALGTSAAHPLYLYIVFVLCIAGAIALLISGWISHRRSAWPRHWQTQSAQSAQRAETRQEAAYPAEPAPVTLAVPEATASIPAESSEQAEATAVAPKKTAARKGTTATATRAPAKKSAAKKATSKKTTPRKTTE